GDKAPTSQVNENGLVLGSGIIKIVRFPLVRQLGDRQDDFPFTVALLLRASEHREHHRRGERRSGSEDREAQQIAPGGDIAGISARGNLRPRGIAWSRFPPRLLAIRPALLHGSHAFLFKFFGIRRPRVKRSSEQRGAPGGSS